MHQIKINFLINLSKHIPTPTKNEKSVIFKRNHPNYYKLPTLLLKMENEGDFAGYQDPYFSDINTRIRDLEEKNRLLKDRLLIVGQGLVDERTRTLTEVQELKKEMIMLKSENTRVKELLERIGTQISNSARKEELAILQRQLNLLRKK
jgi:hypothetical protein